MLCFFIVDNQNLKIKAKLKKEMTKR